VSPPGEPGGVNHVAVFEAASRQARSYFTAV
jgi:hypothetical protein